MTTALLVKGYGFQLRRAGPQDTDFILALRCDEKLSFFLNPTSPDMQLQAAWLAAYHEKPGHFYFIIERISSGDPVGLISLDKSGEEVPSGEWGRWIIKPPSLAALESCFLIHEFGLNMLGWEYLFSRTISANAKVVSFHDNFGAKRVRVLEKYVTIRENVYDSVEHRTTRAEWKVIRPGLLSKIERTSRLLGN